MILNHGEDIIFFVLLGIIIILLSPVLIVLFLVLLVFNSITKKSKEIDLLEMEDKLKMGRRA
jgi:energy-converting hydrogenase Eha subunit H